jgi:uncharacterized protein
MLLVKTYVDRSAIHGLGVFAAEFIRKGTKIWRFVEGFDRAYSPKEFARLPKAARDFLKDYGYRVSCNIRKGEEITNDYREFDPELCAAFLKAKKPPGRSRARP